MFGPARLGPLRSTIVTRGGIEVRDSVASLLRSCFRRALDDWKLLFGFEASVRGAHARVLPASPELVARIAAGGVIARTRFEGEVEGPVAFVLPGPLAAAAVAHATLAPVPEDGRVDPNDADQRRAVVEMLHLFCGSATQGLEEAQRPGVRIARDEERLAVEIAPERAAPLDANGPLMCIAIDIAAGEERHRAWCLVPEALASALCGDAGP